MSRGLIWFSAIVAAIFMAVSILFYVARSHDGPMEIIAGGPFRSGDLVTDTSDWSFLDQHMTIEMQTMVPTRSRTMWIVVVDNRSFVISSYMKSRVGRIWKKWPHHVDQNPNAVIRVEGKLYEMRLVRLTEDEIIPAVLERFNAKYPRKHKAEEIESGNSWLFELTPR